MDPVSATASVLGVVSAIGEVAKTATKFMREVRSARKEMVAVKKELSSLAAVLELLADDFDDATNTSFPDSVLTRGVEIAADCHRVVTEMRDCLRAQQGSSIRWTTSGKSTIEKLKGDLETHKATLSVTLDLVSVIMLRDVKSDTEQIRHDTSAIRLIREDTSHIQNDIDRVMTEISRLQVQVRSVNTAGQRPSGYILERFLTDLKSDAETVLGDADHLAHQSQYQGETNDDEDHGAPLFDSERRGPASFSPPPGGIEDGQQDGNKTAAPIMFTNTQGRRYPIPFAACRTWEAMSELVRTSFVHVEEGRDRNIIDGKYDLIGPQGEIIRREFWDSLVKPGWEVTMKMWERPKLPIKFKDAVGRKYSFPFHMCQTWQGMEHFIKQAFIKISNLSPGVEGGFYDLVNSHGEIIMPIIWDRVIQPGMAISMHMWPLPDDDRRAPRRTGSPSEMPPELPTERPPPPTPSSGTGSSASEPLRHISPRQNQEHDRRAPEKETPKPAETARHTAVSEFVAGSKHRRERRSVR